MKHMFAWPGRGLIYIGPLIRPATPSISFYPQNEIWWRPKAFSSLRSHRPALTAPRVITVDGHPAYPAAIEALKRSGELGRNCRCRRAPYLNNRIEQDHRFVKQRVAASQWFRSVDGALNTIAGYEAMNIIRKGQIRWLSKADIVGRSGSLSVRSALLPDLNATPVTTFMRAARSKRVCDTAGRRSIPREG